MGALLDAAMLAALQDPIPSARIESSTAQSIPNAALTQLTFDTVAFDTTGGSMGDVTANNWILIPKTGIYIATAYLRLSSTASTAERNMSIGVNGSGTRIGAATTSLSGADAMCVSAVYRLGKGDNVQMFVFQATGAAVNTDTGTGYPALAVAWIGNG